MKRYVLMAVALLLIVASIIHLPENAKPAVVAGPGDGENFEVENIKDLRDVLSFFEQRNNAGVAFSSGNSSVLLSEEIEDKPSSKHTSMTLFEETSLSSFVTNKVTTDYVYKTVSTTSIKMNRTLTVYMTENKSYYVSKGYITINHDDFENSDNDLKTKIVFDMQIYVTKTKTIMKFNVFDYNSNANDITIDLTGYIGKWLEVPEEFGAVIFSLADQMNRNTLSVIQGWIDNDMEGFDKVDRKYTLKQTTLKEDDTVTTVDLNDPENPFIGVKINGKSDSYPGDSMRMTDNLTISNIDNTVIEADFTNVEKLSEEEMMEIFGGEL